MLHSVRGRLTLWYTAILALVLVTFSTISYFILAREIRAATDASLANTAREFASAFSNEPLPPTTGSGVLLDFRSSDRQITVFSPSGEIVVSSQSPWSAGERKRIAEFARIGGPGPATVQGGTANDGIRLVGVPIDVMGRRYTAVVARDLAEQGARLRGAARALFLGIPVTLIAAAAGGYLLARKSLAPVTSMSAKARQISAETLDERIAVGNERDELGFLATTLNDLLERLQRSFESQRRFMADASHELRTPVAIIQGEADVTLSRADRSQAEYRESIGIMQNAARKLTRIVQNLFLLARTDAGNYPIQKTRFYIDEVIGQSGRAMRSVAQARQIELTCETTSDAVIVADEDLIHRMLFNLIDNALKFTPVGGSVGIRSERSGDMVTIRISDRGAGVRLEDQPHIFERFYRADRVRRRDSAGAAMGGAGLGLPIARWIAEAHGGTLTLERSDSSGSSFVIALPSQSDGGEFACRPAALPQ
ncbi:MAG: ATP-binding protein [Acidobacteriota bacterium]